MCANWDIQEVLDLSDFDLDFPPVEEDVASIRNVRSALTATGNVAAAARVTSVGNPGKLIAKEGCLRKLGELRKPSYVIELLGDL